MPGGSWGPDDVAAMKRILMDAMLKGDNPVAAYWYRRLDSAFADEAPQVASECAQAMGRLYSNVKDILAAFKVHFQGVKQAPPGPDFSAFQREQTAE